MRCVLLASTPALFWMWVYYRRDKAPEPKRLVFKLFAYGALMAVPVWVLQGWLPLPQGKFFEFYIRVGLLEELFKFVPVVLVAARLKEFDEPMDGIIYAVAAGLGFATVENVLYAVALGDHMIFFRAFTSTPAHACFSGLVGYHLGRAMFEHRNQKFLVLRAMVCVSVLHGTYDLLLHYGARPWAPEALVQGTIVVMVPMLLMLLSWAALKADAMSPFHDPDKAQPAFDREPPHPPS